VKQEIEGSRMKGIDRMNGMKDFSNAFSHETKR
jgi:hypothetical protein